MRRTRGLIASAIAVTAACCGGSAAEARFLQVDPVGYKDQVNLYAYVENDPINKSDPDGQYQRGEGFTDGNGEISKVPNRRKRAKWSKKRIGC